MSMLKVDKLTFAYPGSYDNIFENVSFQVDTSWRLGLWAATAGAKPPFCSCWPTLANMNIVVISLWPVVLSLLIFLGNRRIKIN